LQGLVEALAGRAGAGVDGQSVDQRAGGAPHLHGPEFVEVAADRGLVGVEPAFGQSGADLGLGPEVAGTDQFSDQLLAAALVGHGRVPSAQTSSAASNAFWACRRFS